MINIILVQTSWVKYDSNPVVVKENNFYEFNGIGSPSVILKNDTFYMFYAAGGADSKGRIMLAFSTDGINWTKHPSPVLDVSDSSWDSHFLDTPDIIYDGEYKLYYFGDTDNDPIGSAIGIAVSTDGISFLRRDTAPILRPGPPGSWDELFIESPTVIYDSLRGMYLMYFSGVDSTWRVRIGGAYSFDGISWTKFSENPLINPGTDWDSYSVATPTVVKSGDSLLMYYCGASIGDMLADGDIDTIRVGLAVSFDGINWIKYPGNPIMDTYTPPVDIRGPWAPDVIILPDGSFIMWYETAIGFGLAFSGRLGIYEIPLRNNPCHLKNGKVICKGAKVMGIYDLMGRKARSIGKGVYFVKTDRGVYKVYSQGTKM